ncbi:histidine-type phosphatase [Nitrospirillum pindoramense]|uniref:4-phytase/acid phosphatase n=1 Tax=Nitrospirillum amazonense TaxID=28077 RepID=A0A560GYF0_9PROT|nr:histidine-type phosphatase [Nitrospirillum amazonense]TWB39048.1 4-phytase/acid phosphatase [Nitrospirillum amazonense]
MTRLASLFLAGLLLAAAAPAAQANLPTDATTGPHAGNGQPLRLERVVMLVRHGVRAPLDTEAAPGLAQGEWAAWPVAPSLLTPHGAAAATLMGAYQRQWLAANGLLPAQGCPAEGQVAIWTNSAERTIRTGEAMAKGLAPDCALDIGHKPPGTLDPLFDPFEAGAATVDAKAAVAAMEPEMGDVRNASTYLVPAITLTARGLGCDRATPACDLVQMRTTITPSADNRGVDLRGPVAQTAGAAQIFILQYLEGLPASQVAWGRLGDGQGLRDALAQISRLHGLQFDVFARNAYMAPRKAVALAPRMVQALTGTGQPPVTLLVGHDDNIAAISGLLGVHFQVQGYGEDDPPVGGGLRLELWRDAAGQALVRVAYVAQTPDQVRSLAPLSLATPPWSAVLTLPGCAELCPVKTVTDKLSVVR